ncbi:TPA: replication initiation protein [Salmonella enterica subsp. enterica serovar Typhi str. AG3]|nr:replication initiation protein [Salmonella enterica subsp. enterica serovar Typhi str. AG3]
MRKNEKTLEVSIDNTIKKSNDFALSKLKQNLTNQQLELFSYTIYATQKNGKTSFSKSEFEKYFGLTKYNTKDASIDADKLMELRISMQDLSADKFEYWNVFSKISYDSGTFEFKWNEDMLPHIIELQRNYVLLDLMTTNKFISSYTAKFYEYIKAKHGYWTLEFKKEELIRLFSVEDNTSYVNNSAMFKKRVLNPVIEDLNNLTEINIKYEDIRSGKKIVGYQFIWSKGDMVRLASKRQVDELQLYISTLLEDMVLVFDLPENKRNEALEILQNVRELQKTINYNLKESDVSIKRTTLISHMKRFNEFIGNASKNAPKFYNWLEERENTPV